ncbi:uncharacterized protein SPSK_03672 [Sporothrix schenckii 1099-18]|uniref:Uncharacterized protein n=1 Tax=Sporothrix schenckii 1099-18 TaxID=1397361 RepID=A0A0F2LY78_SPOSC|nr:uncharacterized protein SPSK_03672 [Sporothrix schenckii 1099-18]KJR82413.1 hypothetical protein SPSK_03672 [Sporothrix schenckii 1099-18]
MHLYACCDAARLDGVAARAQRLDGVHDDQDAEQRPQKEAKGNGGLEGAAVVVAAAVHRPPDVDGQGNAAGEPEDHGDPFEGERGEAVEDAGEVERGDADVEQDENGPDGVEEHKVEDGGRGGVAVMVKEGNEVRGEAELDDAKDNGRDVDDANEAVRHFVGVECLEWLTV